MERNIIRSRSKGSPLYSNVGGLRDEVLLTQH